MASIENTSQGPLSLLALPLELRIQIYKAVLSIDPEDFQNNLEAGIPASSSLQFLLSCRQIYDEARFIAFSRTTFIVNAKPGPDGPLHSKLSTKLQLLTPEHREGILTIYLGYGLQNEFCTPAVVAKAMVECVQALPNLQRLSIPLYHPSKMQIREGWVATFDTYWLGSMVESALRIMEADGSVVTLRPSTFEKGQYNLPIDISMADVAATLVIKTLGLERHIDIYLGWVSEMDWHIT
jgi:hypothetical protein